MAGARSTLGSMSELVGATSALACATSALACADAASHDQAPAARADDDPSCPVLVPGTSVTVEDTDKGAALVFVTTGDVSQVRTRAKFLATAHGKHQRPAQMQSDGDVAALQ